MRRTTKFAALLSVSVLALGACGSSDSDGGDKASGDSSVRQRRRLQGRRRRRPQGRHRVRRRRPWRPVVQRLRRYAGLDQASEELGADARGVEAAGRRGRDRPRGPPPPAGRRRLRPDHRGRLRLRRRRQHGRRGVPGHQLRDRRRLGLDERPERREPSSSPRSRARSWSARLPRSRPRPSQIGFIGGVETDLIKKFEAGYIAGAKAVNPDIKVDVKYLTQAPDFSGFGDPAKGKTAAAGHVRQRRRRRLPRRRRLRRRRLRGRGRGRRRQLAIGVDSDQYLTADADQQAVHPDLDAQARRRRRRTTSSSRSATARSQPGTTIFDLEGRRRRLLHHRWLQSTTSRPSSTTTSSRSSTARSRFRPTP